MLKKTAIRTGSAALILMMGACSWFQQPAAPVVSGTTGAAGSYGSSSASGTDNPYGAAPYDPASAGGSSVVNNTPAPYTPPAATPSAPVSGGGSYTPSNAPVDVNAATHTVVRGDTVYNISKRYNISQDDLRAWNNLSENSIGVGQVLRVKPAGYTAPAGGSAVASTPASQPVIPVIVLSGRIQSLRSLPYLESGPGPTPAPQQADKDPVAAKPEAAGWWPEAA